MEEESRSVFSIEDLQCAYVHQQKGGKKVVLCIDQLEIPKGKITVILGLSGSGKSTFIETLGLMNHTIESGTITFRHGMGKNLISRDLWRRPQALAAIRNRHFSFIFQNDFLMPYYSVVENMLIGRMISETFGLNSRTTGEISRLCGKMGLSFSEIAGKKPVELSAGQKQRLSFLRAILKEYTVLFGDEATGNLDDLNSGLLMDLLDESLRLHPDRSAILVSHNIPLSVARAGCIMVLTRKDQSRYEVLAENVFHRVSGGWRTSGTDLPGDAALVERIRMAVCKPDPLTEPVV